MEFKQYRDLPTASISGVEIFAATDNANGDRYTEQDLDGMVAAFDRVGFRPTLKLGHADGQDLEENARKLFGAPAAGYVSRIYRRGKKLLADITDIPRRVYDLLKAKSFSRISAEVYWQYRNESDGQIYPRVLKSIAALGVDIPAITSLREIENLYQRRSRPSGSLAYADSDGCQIRVCNFEPKIETIEQLEKQLWATSNERQREWFRQYQTKYGLAKHSEKGNDEMENENYGEVFRRNYALYESGDANAAFWITDAIDDHVQKTGNLNKRAALHELVRHYVVEQGDAPLAEVGAAVAENCEEMLQTYQAYTDGNQTAGDEFSVMVKRHQENAGIKSYSDAARDLVRQANLASQTDAGLAPAIQYRAITPHTVGAWIVNLPKDEGGATNRADAQGLYDEHRADFQGAARQEVRTRARQWILSHGLSNLEAQYFPSAEAQVRRDYPLLNALLLGEEMDDEELILALKELAGGQAENVF